MAQIRTLKNNSNEAIYPQTLTSAVFNSSNISLENLLALKANQSTTYTKKEVDDMLAAISTLDVRVVTSLPLTEISTTSIYLLKVEGDTNNNYEEYLYINGVWELIGTTKVDLSEYYTKTETNNTFATLENLDNRIYLYYTSDFQTSTGGISYIVNLIDNIKPNSVLIDDKIGDTIPYVLCHKEKVITDTESNYRLIFSRVNINGEINYLKYFGWGSNDGAGANIERTTRTTMEQGAVTAFWTGTQAEYDALATKESTKLYLIKG